MLKQCDSFEAVTLLDGSGGRRMDRTRPETLIETLPAEGGVIPSFALLH